ncbi:surface lipoprotein assembly modifier [Planktotalea sp.]|uniref:surface lipoprotein assembly modifier n=1 Tax=Planktotalea sp. TaxID=2029877 RepID=UPI00329811D3
MFRGFKNLPKAIKLWATGVVLFVSLALPVAAQDEQYRSDQELWDAALSAVKDGDFQRALAPLEILVNRDPDNIDYRFELALALSKVDNYARAKHHLTQLRSTQLSYGARQAVNSVLAEIDDSNPLTGYLSFSLLPESNVNRQTDNETIIIGGLPFRLNTTRQPGVSLQANAGIAYSAKLDDRLTARFRLDLSGKFNKAIAYRDIAAIARTGLSFTNKTQSTYEGGLIFGQRWSAAKSYSQTTGLYFDHGRPSGARGYFNLNTKLTKTKHISGAPDHDIGFVQLSYTHGISANAQITASAFHQIAKSTDLTAAGQTTGVSVSGTYAFRGGLITGLTLSHSVDEREGFSPFFFKEPRKDRKTRLDISIHHRNIRIGAFAPQLLMGLERNQSNNVLADYTNKYVSFGLTRNF